MNHEKENLCCCGVCIGTVLDAASENTEISNCYIGCAGSELNSLGTETEESSKRDGGRTVLRHIIY